MIERIILERAAANLEATYLDVGAQAEGARIERFEGGVACLSRLMHPVSNFVLVSGSGRAVEKEVEHLTKDRRILNVYLLPGACPGDLRPFRSAGLRPAGSLVMMAGLRALGSGEPLAEPEAGFEERLETSRFMAQQFFASHTSSIRDEIALATARSSRSFYAVRTPELLAAAMASRTEGVLGIFNLCVSSAERERGRGTSLLLSLSCMAEAENRLAALQCEPSLELWYQKRGYARLGEIFVFTLDRKPYHAIM